MTHDQSSLLRTLLGLNHFQQIRARILNIFCSLPLNVQAHGILAAAAVESGRRKARGTPSSGSWGCRPGENEGFHGERVRTWMGARLSRLSAFCPVLCPPFVRLLSAFCPRFVRVFVRVLSAFCPRFVRVLSAFCPGFVRLLSGFRPDFGMVHFVNRKGSTLTAGGCRERAPSRSAGRGTPRRAFPTVSPRFQPCRILSAICPRFVRPLSAILSAFCPDCVRHLSGFCPRFVRILSGFCPGFRPGLVP